MNGTASDLRHHAISWRIANPHSVSAPFVVALRFPPHNLDPLAVRFAGLYPPQMFDSIPYLTQSNRIFTTERQLRYLRKDWHLIFSQISDKPS
jgi:hypothetical protein